MLPATLAPGLMIDELSGEGIPFALEQVLEVTTLVLLGLSAVLRGDAEVEGGAKAS